MGYPNIVYTIPCMAGGTQKDRNKLYNLLKQLRVEASLRQVDLAEKLYKPQSYISKYESGEKNLDVLELKEICKALNIELSVFVDMLED
jgi:transcriptional regulator with XRE-family HTH domain